jgi:Protein of unknown function (DUF3551)
MERTMRIVIATAAALAALALAAPSASAAGVSATNGKFCLKGPGTTMNCKYDTMAACDKDKTGTEQCVTNSSTTGSATTTTSKGMKK